MAPVLRARQSLPKDKFSSYFGTLRSQPYNDPNSTRGGSHSYVFFFFFTGPTLISTLVGIISTVFRGACC
jgi:hypothetical protein